MTYKTVAILALFLGCTVAQSSPASQKSVTYRETTGDESVSFTWTLKEEDDIRLTVIRPHERFVNIFDRSGETMRWSHTGPQRHVTARRQDDRIILNGELDGEAVQKEWAVGDAPWYQALSYCLRAFLHSADTTIEFWMIRPDTVDAVKLRAEKAEVASVNVNGRCFDARKVEVCRTGFLSLFWQGEYWYRVEDGLFLKYRGIHGPPGTPPTVVEVDLDSGSTEKDSAP